VDVSVHVKATRSDGGPTLGVRAVVDVEASTRLRRITKRSANGEAWSRGGGGRSRSGLRERPAIVDGADLAVGRRAVTRYVDASSSAEANEAMSTASGEQRRQHDKTNGAHGQSEKEVVQP